MRFEVTEKLRKHSSKVHEDKRIFQCKKCDTSFKTTVALEHHIKKIHEGNRPFQCKFCNKSFEKEIKTDTFFESTNDPHLSMSM